MNPKDSARSARSAGLAPHFTRHRERATWNSTTNDNDNDNKQNKTYGVLSLPFFIYNVSIPVDVMSPQPPRQPPMLHKHAAFRVYAS